jgi:hypothetical protein
MLPISPVTIVEPEYAEREYVSVRGGYRLLALSLIDVNASRLQVWSRNWERWKQAHSPSRYAAARERTREADGWLLDDDPPTLRNKLTFVQICDYLGLEVEQAREQIYGLCDPAALHELWRDG